MNTLFGFSFPVTLLCVTAAMAQQNDWVIVPGKRLGPITAATSRADLNRFFGNANVVDQPVDSGEGEEPATVVFPKMPAAALAIFWSDNRVRDVLGCYQHTIGPCRWHTQNGITIGTSIQQLERLNGRPFEIEPWGSDVGGVIVSWQSGRLEDLFGEGAGRRASIMLGWPESPNGPTPEQRPLIQQMDRQARCCLSNDPAVRRLHPAVERMDVEF